MPYYHWWYWRIFVHSGATFCDLVFWGPKKAVCFFSKKLHRYVKDIALVCGLNLKEETWRFKVHSRGINVILRDKLIQKRQFLVIQGTKWGEQKGQKVFVFLKKAIGLKATMSQHGRCHWSRLLTFYSWYPTLLMCWFLDQQCPTLSRRLFSLFWHPQTNSNNVLIPQSCGVIVSDTAPLVVLMRRDPGWAPEFVISSWNGKHSKKWFLGFNAMIVVW